MTPPKIVPSPAKLFGSSVFNSFRAELLGGPCERAVEYDYIEALLEAVSNLLTHQLKAGTHKCR